MKQSRDTPKWLAERLVQLALIGDHCRILEPSAGEGMIVKSIIEYCKLWGFNDIIIDAIELNKEKHNILSKIESPYDFDAYQADYLQNPSLSDYYDLVIAAPPFKDNIDLAHIQLMYKHLKPGGSIVTLTSPYWVTNNETHQVEFREFLKDKRHEMYMCPDNTFIEKNKTVPTMILSITKSK